MGPAMLEFRIRIMGRIGDLLDMMIDIQNSTRLHCISRAVVLLGVTLSI